MENLFIVSFIKFLIIVCICSFNVKSLVLMAKVRLNFLLIIVVKRYISFIKIYCLQSFFPSAEVISPLQLTGCYTMLYEANFHNVLSRYCECFASGIYCEGCNCVNCFNNVDNEAARREAVEATLERNPNAFRPKIASSPHGTRDSRVSSSNFL